MSLSNSMIVLLSASTAWAAYAPPAYSASSAATTYACNPAHQYPEGQVCTEVSGSLTLVHPSTAPAYASTTAAAPPAYTTAAGTSECADACNKKFDACQTAPDANHAFCASQLASCIGYNPFTNTATFISPTACSATSAAASTNASPAYTTAAGTSDCAAACNKAFYACKAAPDANQSFCSSQLASCIGYNPFVEGVPFATPTACSATSAVQTVTTTAPASGASADACAAACNKAFDACQVAPDANHAFCASQLASCVNYNPFVEGVPFASPTACSATAGPTGAAAGNGTSSPAATTSAPATYTGAASFIGASFGAVAAGAVALLI